MRLIHAALAVAALIAINPLHAQAQGQAAAVTATCKDGTTYSGTSRSGACSHHGGVQAFNAPSAPAQVWVNTASKVYHCPGDRWYGKTKQGEYMPEAAAKAAGDRPDHGKACS